MYLPPSSFNREINGFIFTGGQSQNNSTNDKENFGGAIYIDDCDFQINHCKFYGNEAHTGGAIYTRNSCGYYSNNLWVGNHAYNEGGGILLRGTSGSCNSIMYNCSFTENVADVDGAAILCHAHDLTVHNSIIWDATIANVLGVNGTGSFNINDSNIKGTWIGSSNNNIDVDPNFIDATIGNLRLKSTSMCIDVGNNNVAFGGLDLARNPRILNNTVDMGAYERSCPLDNIIYVDQSATGANTGLSWTDAFNTISEATERIDSCGDLANIYLAEGIYKPSTTNNPSESFVLGNANIYGGFPAGGSTFNSRDWSTYETILSGDIDNNDLETPIAYYFDKLVGDNSNTILILSPSLFERELSGLIFTAGESGYSTFGNLPDSNGGAIFAYPCTYYLKHCKFYGNKAIDTGGAIYKLNTTIHMSNSVMAGNLTERQSPPAGAMNIDAGTIVNCSMTDNWSSGGNTSISTPYNSQPPYPSIQNSIIWDWGQTLAGTGYNLYNSCIGGTIVVNGDNVNNYNDVVWFINPDEGNLNVDFDSYVINIGDNTYSSDLVDIQNQSRIVGTNIDIGAYESPCQNISPDFTNLKSFYLWTNGDSWTNTTANPPIDPWLLDCDPCGLIDGTPWYGITCNSSNQITEIILSNNNLIGNLTNVIGNFTELINLYLDNNQIGGSIPKEISNLSKLENLWLHYNQFYYSIPYELGDLNSIIRIYLYNNNLTGSIPEEFGNLTTLQVLRVYNNNLSGCYIENLTNLCDQLATHSTNANISANNNFDSTWEEYCECGAGFCPCNNVNTWIGGVGDWDIPTNWSLGHVPRACEDVLISQAGDDCTMPANYSAVIYSLEVQLGAVLSIPSTARFTVITDVLDSTWNDCTNH